MSIHSCLQKLGRSVLLASVFLVSNAFAGHVYNLTHSDSEGGGEAESATILVDGAKVKMSGLDEDSEVIFDGSSNTLIMVNHAEKSYLKMDKESIEELSAKLSQAMEEMERQLANVPPAQRKMMERMMKGKMPAMDEPEIETTVNRTGETDTVAGYEAEKVEVSSTDGSSQELWVVPWSKLGGAEDISQAFTGMSSLFDDLMGALSQGPMAGFVDGKLKSGWLGKLQSLEGFPVMAKVYDQAGELVSETLLSDIEERAIAGSEFKAPKGYKMQKMKM
ncbi:DUF4412 domain-containing protein [Pelagicoccus sp. SDUM812003]|uniref:DUF4412 domain-containing protein n=1 Tax=Pelagicoccus sp. SDUM812003 TaxID=3041267 RepID=UPI00280EFA56|nr:DUF4412 domain-containing protein [Pelagicoccus sp. SDUM812003]MDQ8201748.1 DUF4412 domain-containing protein [Pelagicoccus sp. SDUM812003]